MAAFVRPIFRPIFLLRFFRTICQGSSVLLVLAVFAGCTVKSAVENITPTPFITSPQLLHPTELTPFDLAWGAPDMNTHEYDTVIIEAVHTDRIDPENWIAAPAHYCVRKKST